MSQDHATNLLKRFFASDATPEMASAIDQWVREDSRNAKILAELVMLDGLLMVEQKTIDATSILATLVEEEQKATLSLDDLYPVSHPAPDFQSFKDPPVTLRQLASLTGYLLGQALTSKPVYKAYAIAAALILAVSLFFVFNGDDVENPPLADQGAVGRSQIQTPGPSPLIQVATLTAEHDAVWDSRPGQDLYTGQRFTLTQGFAEITTKRGAVAILEAPCTIELTNSDNALYLHAGRLVGICEIDSSKGFLVRTPHAVITDLGTQFGVDVGRGTTSVHVFAGEVRVSHADRTLGPEATTLLEGQSARATAGQAELSPIEHDSAGFAGVLAQRPSPIEKWLHDPALIAAYLVGESEPSQQTLVNHAPQAAGAMAGLIKGKPQWVDGPKPSTHAMRFNSADRTHVLLSDWNQYAPSEQVTFAIWLRTTNADMRVNTVISQWNINWPDLPEGTPRQDRLNLMVVNNASEEMLDIPAGRARLCLQFHDKENDRPVLLDQLRAGGNLTPEDGWVHVIFTMHRENGVALYLNGQQIDSSPGPLTGPLVAESTLPLVVGAKPSQSYYFNGDLAELLILSRALSAREVSDLYQSTSRLMTSTD